MPFGEPAKEPLRRGVPIGASDEASLLAPNESRDVRRLMPLGSRPTGLLLPNPGGASISGMESWSQSDEGAISTKTDDNVDARCGEVDGGWRDGEVDNFLRPGMLGGKKLVNLTKSEGSSCGRE